MYDLFEQPSIIDYGVRIPPEFELVRRTYTNSLNKIKAFYRTRTFTIRNDHILVRVLRTAGITQAVTDDRFYDVATARSPYVGKYFNFTSSINYGKLHDGEIYGKGIKEVILTKQTIFDPLFFDGDWENLVPVEVMYHPFSDLRMIVPNGSPYSSITGYAVITVDISMLLYQFRRFLQSQRYILDSEETGLTAVQIFLTRYVLPNMLDSHLDLAIMNRFSNLFYRLPMTPQERKHPLAVSDYSNKVDKTLGIVLAGINNQKKNYEAVLKSIPAVTKINQADVLLMPDYVRTRQVWWSLLYARLPYIRLLLDLGGQPGINVNRHLVNDLRLAIRYMSSDNSMSTVLDVELMSDVELTILHILNLID